MESGQENPFKKAGVVLLVIGIIDIAVLVYCIANGISYFSSFNIFALIAGILLLQRGVKTARVVRWFSIFLVVAFIGGLLMSLATTPFALLVTEFKVHTLVRLGSSLLGVFVIAVLIWIYKQLSQPTALQLLAQAGFSTGSPRSAYLAGIVFTAILFVFTVLFLHGDTAKKAEALAKEQLGPDYNYHVVSYSKTGDTNQANVTAYTATEIKTVQVQW
jgi:hypothetical protein